MPVGADAAVCCDLQQQAAPSLRFQLPSEPNTYVDLVDDEDVQLMFDEWADYTSNGRHSTAKLHIFVDWQHKDARAGRESNASAQLQRPTADVLHQDVRGGAVTESPTGPHSTGSPLPRGATAQHCLTPGHWRVVMCCIAVDDSKWLPGIFAQHGFAWHLLSMNSLGTHNVIYAMCSALQYMLQDWQCRNASLQG